MTLGLAFSLLMHAALIGYALLAMGHMEPHKPKDPIEAIVADVITESDLNRMRKGVREAKLDAAQAKDVKDPDDAEKQPPKPRPVVAQPPPPAEEPPPAEPEFAKEPPPPPPTAKVEPPPAPKAEPPKPSPDKLALAQKLEEMALQKAAEAKAEAEAEAKAKAEAEAKAKAEADAKAKAEAEAKAKAEEKRQEEEKKKLAEQKRKEEEKRKAEEKRKRHLAELKRKAEERKKAEEKRKRELAKKKQFDANRLSALLDKTPDPKRAAAANDAPDKATDAKGPVRGDTFGRDHTISANEASFLAGLMRQAVSRCWNINAGLDGIQQMVVKVEIKLTRDGQLAGQPRVVNDMGNPVFRDAADSAVRALVQCQPYVLPPDKYEGGWEHMILTFDPARMF